MHMHLTVLETYRYTPAYQRTYANTDTILTCLEYLFKLGYRYSNHCITNDNYFAHQLVQPRRVEWKCDSLNVRSAATAVKLGFTPCGVFRNHMIIKGMMAPPRVIIAAQPTQLSLAASHTPGKSRDTAWFEIIEEDSKKVIAALHAKLDKYKQ